MPSIWLQPHLSLLVPSCGSSRFWVSVFDIIVHIFDCSIRNSDPRMRTVLVQGLNSNFDSVLKVLKARCDFQNRSNSRVSSDPPFWFRCFVISWKGVFATSYRMQKFPSISCHEVPLLQHAIVHISYCTEGNSDPRLRIVFFHREFELQLRT